MNSVGCFGSQLSQFAFETERLFILLFSGLFMGRCIFQDNIVFALLCAKDLICDIFTNSAYLCFTLYLIGRGSGLNYQAYSLEFFKEMLTLFNLIGSDLCFECFCHTLLLQIPELFSFCKAYTLQYEGRMLVSSACGPGLIPGTAITFGEILPISQFLYQNLLEIYNF